jgi:acyl-coenzyme A synthetase/AMP-(fatty) acid ligase
MSDNNRTYGELTAEYESIDTVEMLRVARMVTPPTQVGRWLSTGGGVRWSRESGCWVGSTGEKLTDEDFRYFLEEQLEYYSVFSGSPVWVTY